MWEEVGWGPNGQPHRRRKQKSKIRDYILISLAESQTFILNVEDAVRDAVKMQGGGRKLWKWFSNAYGFRIPHKPDIGNTNERESTLDRAILNVVGTGHSPHFTSLTRRRLIISG